MARTALVVDDSMLVRHAMCRFLEDRGFSVESASNGMEALEVLSTLRPSIIVTDLVMPKMSGRELIAKLKDNPATEHIPIVVVAGKGNGQPLDPDPHADFVIYKDIDVEQQLEKAVSALCGTAPA